MSKIIVIVKGSVTAKDVREIRKAGHIVIEAKAIEDVRVLDNHSQLPGNVMLNCAIKALSHGNDSTARLAFGNLVREQLASLTSPSK